MKLLNDILTGKDGETFDIARVLGATTVLTFLGLAVYSVVKNPMHHFDMQSFGIGAGAVIAAMGAALGMKSKTEPEPKP